MTAEPIDLQYAANPTASRFHRDADSLFRGIMGPIGSGKSVACCLELWRLATAQAPHSNVRHSRWGVLRGTYPELKSTTIRTWQDWFPPAICPIKWEYPITGRMKLPLPDGTLLDMELIFLALERPEDTKKLLSLELTGMWVNEAREIREEIIHAAMGRIGRFPALAKGGHTRKALIADTNPPDEDHWWYRWAEEETPEKFAFYSQPPALLKTETGYIANPDAENTQHLTDGHDYYLDQVSGKDAQWIKVYLLGQYGTIQSGQAVYADMYNDAIHCSKVPFLPMKGWLTVLAFDFGLTPACLVLQLSPRGQVRAVEEFIGEGVGLERFVDETVLPKINTAYRGCPIYVTGDPAGNTRADSNETTCYEVLDDRFGSIAQDVQPASSNATERRLTAVRRLLSRLVGGQAGFQISPACRALRKGFNGAYKYAYVQGTTRIKPTPEKNMSSHIHDAAQYAALLVLEGFGGEMAMDIPIRATTIQDRVVGY